MKSSSCICFFIAIYGSITVLAETSVRAIQIPFQKEKRGNGWDHTPKASRLRQKRSNAGKTILQVLDNKDYLFYANVSIGTPPQNLRLHIDTGSSDIWVEYANSTLCTSSANPCGVTGVYNNKTSSSYKYVSSDFSIKYVDQEFATGDYALDIFHIGGASITELQFGMGLVSTSEEGIMGIGFKSNEAQTVLGKEPYDNLPYLMEKQGLINSVAYSVWLNDLDAATGQILFGGIDTQKYHGSLTTIPIDKRAGETMASEFLITLTGITLTNGAGANKTIVDASASGIAVLLDTGASFTYLPTDVANDLASAVGATYSAAFGGPTLPCSKKSLSGTINFEFSGVTIKVPLDEFIVDAVGTDGSAYVNSSTGEPICFFGILGSDSSSSSTLGDTFQRSAYVVYDLSNEEISLAQTNFNATSSHILEIKSGRNGVPDATGVSSALTIVATATGAAGGVVSITPTTTGSASATHTSKSGAISEKAGISHYISISIASWFATLLF